MMLLWMILSLCTLICITANCFSLLRWNDIWSNYYNPSLHVTLLPMDTSQTIHVLIYETEATFRPQALNLQHQLSRLRGFRAVVFGPGFEYEGYGSKYAAVYPILQDLPAEDLVVLTDSRDVLINIPLLDADRYHDVAAAEFFTHYETLVRETPQAVILSAEAQCCVSALTHALPQDYFYPNGTRHRRACPSGASDCGWAGGARPWEWRMQARAQQEWERKENDTELFHEDIYLNAGLMVGSVANLMHLIEAVDIAPDEDDQAVLTDYMLLHDDRIRLDYGQAFFGNNRADFAECVFSMTEDRLVHAQTMSTPLFIHSPGGYYRCHDRLSILLGIPVHAVSERQLAGGGCNYGRNHSNCEPPDDNGNTVRPSLVSTVESWVRRILDILLEPIRRLF